MRRVAALAATLLVVASSASPASAARAQESSVSEPVGLTERLDRYLKSQIAAGFAGVVLVEVSGDVVLHEAYGAADKPFDRDSCFWIASISKMFTAATAVALQEEGELDLHTSIGEYLDGVPADKRAITLHHLLTHTSGLDSTYVAEGITDRDRAVRALLETPLVHPIGSAYLYSSDGYSLAALIVETVAERPFEEVVRKTLLTPLGMTSTGFWGHPVDPATCSLVPYETSKKVSAAKRLPNYGFRGPTGMRSTAADLRRWYNALVNDQLLSAESRREILTPHFEKRPQVAYGYGWNIVETSRETRMIAHTGQDDLLRHVSYLYAFPDEEVLIIVLADSTVGISTEALRGVRHIIFP